MKPDHYMYQEGTFSPKFHYKTVLVEKTAALNMDITNTSTLWVPCSMKLESARELH